MPGSTTACALAEDATFACWGGGVSIDDPFIDPGRRFDAIALGETFTCALDEDGEVGCWDHYQQRPLSVPEGAFDQLSIGHDLACVLDDDGTVSCWVPDSQQDIAETVTLGAGVVSISVSSSTVCGVRPSGDIVCWGDDPAAILEVPGGEFTDVSTAAARACAVAASGEIACWGNQFPRLGGIPEGEFASVSVDLWHSCALRTDATIACWGLTWNANDAAAPRVDVGELWVPDGEFTAVAMGVHHACGIRPAGTVECWSFEDPDADPYVEAPEGSFQAISSTLNNSCGIRDDGSLECWDIYGLGDEYREPILDVPAGQFSQVAAGFMGSCALQTSGAASCWGSFSGETTEVEDQTFSDISVAGGFACGVQADKHLACWSIEDRGTDGLAGTDQLVLQVGGTKIGVLSPPETMPGELLQVSAASTHLCVLTTEGKIDCWGALTPAPGGVAYEPFPQSFTEQRMNAAFGF